MGWRRCGRVARTAVCGTWSGDKRGIRMATHPLSIVYFLVAAALGAIGQYLYKTGAESADGTLTGWLVNPRVWGGVACYVAVMVLFLAGAELGRADR